MGETTHSEANAPMVSVIMIFLNAERFMEESIVSVLAQTYERWELLLVDDGSTDTSTQIALKFAARFPDKIRYLQHPGHTNLGTGPSRNFGMDHARGEYLAFLDADDIYLPYRLERHVQAFAQHERLGMVISQDLYWRSWQENTSAASNDDELIFIALTPDRIVNPPDLLTITLSARGAVVPGVCSFTFHRSFVVAGCRIPENFIDQYEDQSLYVQLLLKAPVMVLDCCLARYRQHEGSLTQRAKRSGTYRPGRAHTARFTFLLWLQQYLEKEAIHQESLHAALHKQLWPMRHPVLNALVEVSLDVRRWLIHSGHALGTRLLPRSLVRGLTKWYLRRQQLRMVQRVQRAAARIGE